MKSIFPNTNLFHMSDPQGSWLFDVMFFDPYDSNASAAFADMIKTTLIPTSVTLPSYHTENKTMKWFGTEKSFPVIRTYGGDCTMNFDVRSEPRENNAVFSLAQVNALFRSETVREIRRGSVNDMVVYHPELEHMYTHAETAGDVVRDGYLEALKFRRIHVRVKNKTVDSESESPGRSTVYEYNNCLITDFGFNNELDYSSDAKLTCKLTFHYDMWHVLREPPDGNTEEGTPTWTGNNG